jgi:hypothetical protein
VNSHRCIKCKDPETRHVACACHCHKCCPPLLQVRARTDAWGAVIKALRAEAYSVILRTCCHGFGGERAAETLLIRRRSTKHHSHWCQELKGPRSNFRISSDQLARTRRD